MPAVSEEYEVIVVGAGPVGLSLALGLARRGRRVLVLEREAGTAEHSRAPAIWPRTQEILAELGVLDDFLAEGLSLARVEVNDVDRGRVLLSLPLEELGDRTAQARLLVLPQSRTEALLVEALRREPRAELRFSTEVLAVLAEPDGVRVRARSSAGARPGEEEFAAAIVVGCDGAHSLVRRELGADFDGETYAMRAALADIELAEARAFGSPRLTTEPRPVIAIRMGERLWRLILPIPPGDDGPGLDERRDRAAARLFDVDYRPVWSSEFRLHRRVSSVIARGRVVLAGDAAHLNSPVGGQGMNAGIQDAAALWQPILATLEGGDPAPLRTYAEDRRAAIEAGVNRFTDLMTRVVFAGRGRFLRPIFTVLDAALAIPALRRSFLLRVAMLD